MNKSSSSSSSSWRRSTGAQQRLTKIGLIKINEVSQMQMSVTDYSLIVTSSKEVSF